MIKADDKYILTDGTEVSQEDMDEIYAADGVDRMAHTITVVFQYPVGDDYPRHMEDFFREIYSVSAKYGYQ